MNTFGTGKISEEKIVSLIVEHFDLTPYGLTKMLDLLNTTYRPTATYGHFGRSEDSFTWEKTDMVDTLRSTT